MRHIILLFALLCAACSSSLPTFKPYKMDIQQGNVVTSKMMLQLRPGMNKTQVRFIMGTPLIQDTFHKDRWDYFYQMRKDGKIIEQRRVILEFESEKLVRVRGDVIPAGSEGSESAQPEQNKAPIVLPPKKPEEKKKGLLDRLKFWEDDEKAPDKTQAAPADLVKPEDKAAAPAKVESRPEAKPEPKAAEPVIEPKAPESKPEEAPVAAPAAEPVAPAPAVSDTPAPQPPAEAPMEKPVAEPEAKPAEPVKAPEPKPAEAKPAAKPVAKPKAEAKPAPKVAPKPAPTPEEIEKDLPPEDEPGYFERMLEKIGF